MKSHNHAYISGRVSVELTKKGFFFLFINVTMLNICLYYFFGSTGV
jgi:hypothetical protein